MGDRTKAYWSPDKVSPDTIGATAVGEAFVAHNKELRFAHVATVLVA